MSLVTTLSSLAHTSTAPNGPQAYVNNAISLWPSDLKYSYTTSPKPVPAQDDPARTAANYCTDHMITTTWHAGSGWSKPELKPYGNLSISPTASVLHYATECFEGMKVFRGFDGKLRLFRPDCNSRRMVISADRICLPIFDPDDLEQLICKLLEVDGPKFLPVNDPGTFLYLRPTIIGTHCGLGVTEPKEAVLFIIAAFMPDLSKLSKGLRLFASRKDGAKPWPGGHGFAKVGANYGPTLQALGEAKALGYDQILWLFGPEGRVTECGGSNFFVVWRSKTGSLRIQTAPLGDRLILDGVVRRSILELARERICDHAEAGIKAEVVEEPFTMCEIVEAAAHGRLVEAFTCGTAYFVCPISSISYEGKEITIPMAHGNTGKLTALLKSWLSDIFFGNVHHPWATVINEK